MPRRSILMLLFTSLCFAAAWGPSGELSAADDADSKTFTEPPKNDPGFALQGEFVGPISLKPSEYQPLGLQVRSLGQGRFEARQFTGGLPGQKKYQGEAVSLVGRRSSDFLVLSGGPWAIVVEKDHCLVLDRTGNRIGRLDRIERQSPTLGAEPPEAAIVLFDGSEPDLLTGAEMTSDGLLMEGADFKPMVQDFDLHLEFRLPFMPSADGQARGNSGVYLQSRYECQVLDSFAQEVQINGCGSLYRFKKPDVNMCFPPLVWQTYDIHFTAPRWAADGSKLRDAHVTAWLNGVKIHDDVALPDKTGAGQPEAPSLLPTKLQNHHNPVRFRNVWMVDRGLNSTVKFPVQGDGNVTAKDNKQKSTAKKNADSGNDQKLKKNSSGQQKSKTQTTQENESASEKNVIPQNEKANQGNGDQQNKGTRNEKKPQDKPSKQKSADADQDG